jgi:hypothetical protein
MSLLHNHLFTFLWVGWALYWWLLSKNVKAVKRMESTPSRLMHAVPLTVAALMLWVPSPSHSVHHLSLGLLRLPPSRRWGMSAFGRSVTSS